MSKPKVQVQWHVAEPLFFNEPLWRRSMSLLYSQLSFELFPKHLLVFSTFTVAYLDNVHGKGTQAPQQHFVTSE